MTLYESHTVPASITTPPRNTTVVSPGNATLTCTADGVPAPNVTWTRVVDGMPVQLPEMSPDNTVIVSSTETDERTTVSTVSFFFTVTFIAAEYTCHALNLLGTDAQAAILTVHGEKYFPREVYLSSLTLACSFYLFLCSCSCDFGAGGGRSRHR